MAVNKLGKKGVFLTFISIIIIAAIIIIFTPTKINVKEDISVIKTRVENVNEYVLDLENVYLERTLQAIGRKTILSLILYVDIIGPFATSTDFENAFAEVLLSGTIGGTPIDSITGQNIMTGNTYNDWIDKIKTTAQNTFNIDTTFNTINIADIQVNQATPWFVDVEADITFSATSETASWTKDVTIKAQIPVENFDDPYYLANTDPNYVNKIRRSGTKFDEWDVNKVKDFIRDGNYTHFQNSNAPSFLMRFYDDVSASSCCGIESLVNPNNPQISNKDVSYAGYLYWSDTENCNNPPKSLFKVDAINTEFTNLKFDLNHLAKYKLTADEQECPPPS